MLDYSILSSGFAAQPFAGHLIHTALGGFFAISGFHKLSNKARHQSLINTLTADHVPLVKLNQWLVPIAELTAGTGLLLGFAPASCAAVIAVLMLVAMCVDGRKTVQSYHPIDEADKLDDWLYLPETWYLIGAIAVICGI